MVVNKKCFTENNSRTVTGIERSRKSVSWIPCPFQSKHVYWCLVWNLRFPSFLEVPNLEGDKHG
jgi:hypothetical protein